MYDDGVNSLSPAEHEPRTCDQALTAVFSVLGKRWNGVLLGTLGDGPAGFVELRRAVGGISDSVLSERLAELTRSGLVQREVQEGPPLSTTYRLTEAGDDLVPALAALTDWARANLRSPQVAADAATG